jgi:hypothetical protein
MKSTIKRIAPDILVIDPIVQRVEGIDQVRVANIAAEFKQHMLGTFVISERKDGRLVVLDGMHRREVCMSVGHNTPVTCEVFTGLSIAEEAELFVGRNNARMPSAISKFHARVLMGEPAAMEITSILERHQWHISVDPLPGCLAAVVALESVYRSASNTLPNGAHPDVLDRVLEILTIAWEWDTDSVKGHMLSAVAQLVGRFASSIDTKKLVDEMQATRPDVLIGRAKTLRDAQGGTVPAALAKILAGMHNKKRRNNLLPEWVWIR